MINSTNSKSTTELSNLDKAAILVRFMGEEYVAKIFGKLTRDDVIKLSNRVANLPGISNEMAHNVIQQFFKEFSDHSGVSGAPRSFLESTLNQAIGNGLAQKMLDGIYGDALKEDFQKLEWVPPEILARSFKNQHVTMQAALLAFLPSETANNVLKHFPKDQHLQLITKVGRLKEVNATIIEELKIAVKECMDFASSENTANIDGVKQAADIINRYEGDQQELLESMKLSDETLAHQITENMYDFFSLARQDEETLDAIVQAVEREQLALALKGSDSVDILAAIKKSITQRMGEALEEQISLMGTQRISLVQAARKELMDKVRSMNEAEEIQYKIFEEKVVE